MRPAFAAFCLSILATKAFAEPLTLYEAEKDPLAVPGNGPVVACGGVPGACPTPGPEKQTKLPFTYGVSVSTTFVGSNHGSAFGEGVSGWLKPDGTPLTIYFDVQHFQPLGK